jgi:acyl carrier protein
MLRSLFRRRRRAAAPSPPSDWKVENETRIARLRRRGITIGTNCVIFTEQFSLEPFLVEIGDRVAIAGGTMFLTHDGAAWLLRRTRPEAQHFGRITVGSDTFIGQNCIILPGASLVDDLGVDSLLHMTMVVGLEQRFDIMIPDAIAARCAVVGDVIEAVRTRCVARTAARPAS